MIDIHIGRKLYPSRGSPQRLAERWPTRGFFHSIESSKIASAQAGKPAAEASIPDFPKGRLLMVILAN
jgi:hypothetical protein